MPSRFVSLALLPAFICNVTFCAAAPQDKPSTSSNSAVFLANAKVVTITNLDELAGDAFQRDRSSTSLAVDSMVYKATSDEQPLRLSREQFYEYVRQQKEQNDAMESRMEIFNKGRELIGGAADAGGPVGIFASIVTNTYLDRFNDRLRSAMEDSQHKLAEQYFAGRTVNVERLRTALAAGHDAFVGEVEKQAGMPHAFDDLPDKEKSTALARLGEFTLTTIALQGEMFQSAQTANKKEFRRLRDKVGNIENCQKALASGMTHLMTQTRENTEQLATLTEEMQSQHKDLGLMQTVMFGHLTVDEQIELVQNSTALGLSDDQRKSMLQNLTQRKGLLDSAQKWNEFVNTGKDLLGIADKLGVDKNIVQNVQQGLAIGNAAFSAVSAALTGNYIGAALAVVGMFGGGGMDAETAHYSAIMAKLDEIIETQRQIIETQKKILEGLQKIADMIIRNQIELRGLLADIFALQLQTLNAVIQIKSSGLNPCIKFLDDRSHDENFDSDKGAFKTYDSMTTYFDNKWDLYDTCKKALDESIGVVGGAHGIFFGYPVLEAEAAKISPTEFTSVLDPVRDLEAPYFAYLQYYVPDIDRHKKTIIGSFFAPSIDFNTLEEKEKLLGLPANSSSGLQSTGPSALTSPEAEKLQNLRPISALSYRKDNPAVQMFYTNFAELLSPEAVIQYSDIEMDLNGYRALVSPNRRTLLSIKDVYAGKGDSTSATIALECAFDWLSLAIAQQDFLTGDSLLPFLNVDGFGDYAAPNIPRSQLVKEPSDNMKQDQQRALAHYLLAHNSVLLQNAVRYRIYKAMSPNDGKEITPFGYAWAYTLNENSILLQSLLKDILSVEYVERKTDSGPDVPETGWYAKYVFTDYSEAERKQQTIMVPLPSIEEVSAKAFAIPTSLEHLIECREKVNALLATNQLLKKTEKDPQQYRNLKMLVLLQHYEPNSTGKSGQ